MDKKIIALAVAAVIASPLSFAATATVDSSTTQKVQNNQDTAIKANTIYSGEGASIKVGGRAEARMAVQDGKSTDNSRVRFNLLGKVEINDDLYGVGFYEGEYQTNDADGENDFLDNRKTFAGIGGSFGLVTYGKNDGALGQITDFTDIMAYHGAVAGGKLAVADRTDNMVSYAGAFDDLSVKASLRFADNTTDAEVADTFTDNDADGYSLSAAYSFSDLGLGIGAGVANQDETDEYNMALSYEIGGFYLAGQYNVINDATVDSTIVDSTAYDFAVAYTMGQYVISATYGEQELDTGSVETTVAESAAIDMTYYFKKNFRTYISYNFNMLDKDDVGTVNSEDELALGLRYDF
ncbi:porin [Vibrio algarum]|uniref:Porin n=1 Tax=Vibrio algarum TaxID=3020714 RepID=A0ABT4YUY5_9VIBR|nr:porin [Vibrio sp. KJ40-1]MDB1125394.1 porin [Vibrio sp. KJ40-1]